MSHARGGHVWRDKYESLTEDYETATSQLRLAQINVEKTIGRSENYKRLRDEQREKWRIANNRLHNIWAIAKEKPIHRLIHAIDCATKEHRKFIPDPQPNGKRGACVTRIQEDGSIGNEVQEF
jgi:hypothetical protein